MTRLGDRTGLRWRSSDECRASSFNPASISSISRTLGMAEISWDLASSFKRMEGVAYYVSDRFRKSGLVIVPRQA
ncbi:hypothetical protein [Microcoleus vaginatus]|uniref:hypothetical protein n=1 Tax=Microcoleus vaginatus TaxID=119532 RepID=UPI0002D4AF1D